MLLALSQLHAQHSALLVTDESWRDFSFTSQTAARLRMRRGRTALASKPRGLMLLKLPASSGKTGAMRAGITGTDSVLMSGANRGAGQSHARHDLATDYCPASSSAPASNLGLAPSVAEPEPSMHIQSSPLTYWQRATTRHAVSCGQPSHDSRTLAHASPGPQLPPCSQASGGTASQ